MSTLEWNAEERPVFHAKDPISAATHFGGFLAAILGMPFLLIQASAHHADMKELGSLAVFMLSMIVLYGASASYHSFNISYRANMVLKRIDHCSIFLLIAGSYTPVCVIGLAHVPAAKWVLVSVWAAAFAGILFKLFYVTCPRWVSSVIYLGMGWACAAVLPSLIQSLGAGFAWLLAGGLFYSIGGFIYALKKPLFPRLLVHGFGNHELFHCFVLAGSFCHFLLACTTFIHLL